MATPEGTSVLKALDVAKTQVFHFKTIVIAGMGFFTDSYDLFVVGLLLKLLGRIYYTVPGSGKVGSLPIRVSAAVTSVAFCGTLAGQLFFGATGDRVGRKKAYGFTLVLMVVASLGQGLSIGKGPNSVMATLCFFRFWLGFGIGGDYPLSATIMSEYSNTATRGAFVAAVFAMQGVGYLVAAAVTIIVTECFRARFPESNNYDVPPQADYVWRIILMFGAVPAALTIYTRSQMPETARYTALVRHNDKQAALDMGKVLHTQFNSEEFSEKELPASKRQTERPGFGLFSPQFARRHGKELFGACVTWFLLDISYYSQNLYQTQVFTAVNWVPSAGSMGALKETFVNARATAFLALFSTVPGYWFTVTLIDWVGRKPIQLMGFFMMGLFMVIIGLDFYALRRDNHLAFIVLYAFTFFFSNFGPNSTTFIVPSELFPARLRSTCHGIASAAGKAGAITGAFGFLYASQDPSLGRLTDYPKGIGYKWTFFLLGMCAFLGMIVTLLCIPETRGQSLEFLSGEDAESKDLAQDDGAKKVSDNTPV
jgi:PHS family inorganic phosphate transporter-like MFS transporter